MDEGKVIFGNIKNLRHILTEGVGQDVIIKSIQNHEWVYLYYDAQDVDGKNATGYRTVRPYVLGTNAKGNTMLRAWQDNSKNSWHFTNRATRPDSAGHDYWNDSEGSKPGWRMFNVEKITKIYPTGKKFNDDNGLPLIPAGYHEGGDDDMTNIIAYVSTKTEPDIDYKHDKDYEPDIISKTDRDKAMWDSIRRGNKNSRKITADDVVKLRDMASRVHKKSHGSYLVVIDDKQNFQLMLNQNKDKYNVPDTAIVGSLTHLYDTLVNNNVSSDDKFFNDVKNKTQTDLRIKAHDDAKKEVDGVNERKVSSIPHNKSTFFK